MNDLRNIIKKYNFNIKKYKKIGNVHILCTNNGTYCLKERKRKDIKKIIEYLKAKQFHNILDIKSDDRDDFEITDYIEEVPFLKEDKAMEAVYLISMLHNKTTFYKSISLDEVKCFYENHIDKIIDLRNYIDNLCYSFDENLFLSSSQYLFIKNITILFNSLDYSKHYIEKWYNIVKNKTSKRVVMNHNNLDLSHIIIGNKPYIINWNKASIDSPVMDLYSLFKKNFLDININSLFNVYTSKYQLLKEEMFLLFSLLLLPEKIEFSDCEIHNTKIVYDHYKYLSSVMSFVSEYNLKYNK